MKKLLYVTIAMLMLAPFAWGQHRGGTISGTVLGQHEGGNIALRFAQVRAFVGNSNMPSGMATTDSLGNYTLNVPFGQFVIRAEAVEFTPLWYNNVSERTQATPVMVDSVTNPTGIDFVLIPQGPPPGQGTISGTVLGQNDTLNVPVTANVYAYHPDGNHPVAMAMTDRSGNFTLHVTFGNYQIRAEAYHYVALWYNNVSERAQATTVVVDSATNPTGINFLLAEQGPPPPPPGQGTISGTVVGQDDSSTVPLGAIVYAYHPNSDHPTAMAQTDRSGNYTLHLQFGDYQIKAEAYHYVSLWYNNVSERAQATTVVVDSAANPTGINFLLSEQGPPPPPPAPVSGISGTVINSATSLPIPGAMVTAINANNRWMHFIARTDSLGAYLIGARSGEYIVQACARDYNSLEYSTHVTVPDSTIVPNINFALTPLVFGSISGMVTDTSGTGIAGAFVEARKLGMPYLIHARTDSTGAYTLTHVVTGAYSVKAFSRGYNHGTFPDSVVVAEGQNVTGINIVLGAVPPSFNGTIVGLVTDDSTGTPIAHAVVVAVGDNGYHRFRYTYTNDDGTYTLDGLSQVPYKVFSSARGYMGEFFDNVNNYADATPVTPNATGINFALTIANPGPRLLGGYILSLTDGIAEGSIVYASIDGAIVGVTVADIDGYYTFEGIEPGSYDVSVVSVYGDGQVDQPVDAVLSDVGNANVILNATSIGNDTPQIPTVSSLAQNYPNPFNAQTMISFNLATSGRVELDIYNMIGQKIVTLVDGSYNPGTYNVIWNGRDAAGSTVSSGIYYYRLKTDAKTETMKMTLLK
jgi:hypothetical protein